jgi:type IV pilus assembly protein PilW
MNAARARMPSRLHCWRKRRARGLSIVELLVAITLVLLLALAVTTLLTNNDAARREIDSTAQQIENGRYAMELVRNDVRLAGYYGEFVPPFGAVSWQLPANPCDPTLANLGWSAIGPKVPVPISGFESHDPALAALSPQCINHRAANSDVLVVRRTATSALTPPLTASNTPYLQVSLQTPRCASGEAAFVFDTPQTPSAFTLHQRDCVTPAVVRRYLVHVYYVSTCDNCAANDGIPTLKRVELSAGSMATSSLAQGITDFRVDYGLDTNYDGFPDVYQKCGASGAYSGPCTAADWANVTVVKAYLLARNAAPTPGYVDSKTYVMGLSGALPAFGEGDKPYRRRLYSAPIRVMGPSDQRELP